MTTHLETRNRALVLEAFDTLFNKRGYAAAVRSWSSNYVPHSGHIEPGRQGVFKLIKGAPASLKVRAGRDRGRRRLVIVDGRCSGTDAPGTGSPLTSCAPTVC